VDLTKLGLSQITTTAGTNGTVDVSAASSNVTLVKPSDASIIYNGAEITNASNTITVNGLSVTVKGVTAEGATDAEDEVINVNVTNDVDAVYTMVKDFVKSYNELLKTINEAYNADTAKGYEPLTDDQKEAMSEDQEKQWEDKIKNSLLRRDSVLGTISNSMRTIFAKGVKVEGKNYSLSSFGIGAVDYTEKGLLHINGNSEDTLTAAKEDSLKKAITENPDAVMEVLTTLSSDLYSELTDKMKSTSLKSALTVYNDKEMKTSVASYTKDISNMEDKLQDMETRYYKQFTAMETAMSKMNSQSSSLTSLLGGQLAHKQATLIWV
jgi:flagellar hook-associated protein 2